MATAILGVLVTPLVEIGKLLATPLKKQVGYLVKYHRNTKLLRTETEELRKTVESARCAIEEARCRGETVTKDIELWFKEVERTMLNVHKFLVRNSLEGQNGDAFVCCTNLRSRFVASKRAVKLLKVVSLLKGQAQVHKVPVSRVALPPSIEVMPSGDFEAFESTRIAMENIIVALGEDRNKVIGVYGMGGVGKTSIVKEVAKHSKKMMNMFDDVVVATVSQNPVLKIQRDIAECLGMHLGEENEYVRSLRLAERLKLSRRTLIILDDVWERLDFSQVGIPSGKDKSNCKIVITTRNRDVCSEMYCDVSIEVRPLSEEDSWSLFKKASSDIVESVDFRLAAEQVVEECGGLPIALVTVGRALRNKELRFWEDAAYQLRQSRPLNIKGMHEKVFACLRISFDQFQSEESKLCYLYCSLFPEDHDVKIEDLLRYGVGEGLFYDLDTVDEARSRVHSIISNLEASCLLLSNSVENCAKMHSVYRDLAITIATSDDYSFMVQASNGLKEWPRKPKLEYVMRLSLINNDFTTFTGLKQYPELILLLLQNNTQLKTISDEFFAGMTALKVLDLSNIPKMVALPVSLSCLTSLRTLCVENNNIADGSALGGLTSLEILSLRNSTFSSFPEEIRKLINLRLLDMTNTQVGSIPANVISSLTQLEELYMRGSYDGWDIASLAEIFSLEQLNTLHIDIGKFGCITNDIFDIITKLKKFRVHIGDVFDWQTTLDRSLCFNFPSQVPVQKPLAKWVKTFLQTTLQLSVRWNDLTSLDQLHPEYLQLGVAPSVSFQWLKQLKVEFCGNIKSLFTFSAAAQLIKLQRLEISNCDEMEVVVSHEASVGDISEDPTVQSRVLFPELQILKLTYLKKMRNMTQHCLPLDFPALQYLTVLTCPSLKKLPFGAKSLHRIHEIRAERWWVEELELKDNEARSLLQDRFSDVST